MSVTDAKSEIRRSATEYKYPWTPDRGDGTFCNPVLYADYSDPDVIRHGNDFWLTASSFNCTPGLPILHSSDLVNWTLVNHALKNLPAARYAEVQPGCGVWAPSIRFHAGRFWIFFPMPDEGIYVTTATDPRGQWSEPHLLHAGKGLIDPCPLWDDDGHAYLVHAYAFSRSGQKHKLRVAPMAPDGTRLLGEGRIVFEQPERHPTLEGPKFLKRDGWYYLLAPAGGVKTGWQLALRARNVFGPYEEKIVLHQGSTPVNGPHQGALVDTPGGEWWFLHFQDAEVYGRIVHLQPVEWREGWPLMGKVGAGLAPGEPVWHQRKPNVPGVRSATPATSDEFSSSRLGLQWQWHANHREDWASLAARNGWLRLAAQPGGQDLGRLPHLLLQKFPARSFRVVTSLEPAAAANGLEAGLVIAGDESAALAVRREAGKVELIYRQDEKVELIMPLPGGAVRLQVSVADGGMSSFACLGADGQPLAVRAGFQARPGRWIGAKVGIYCTGPVAPDCYADFDYVRFASLD